MTRSEQAYVKRLQKRIDDMFSTLCVISTWLSFPDDPQVRCYHIGKLVTEKILTEKEAKRKEENNGLF